MIPSAFSGPFVSDKLADEAEAAASKLRQAGDSHYFALCPETLRLHCSISELLVASAFLRRSPVAQQRLVKHLIDKASDPLRGCLRQFDA